MLDPVLAIDSLDSTSITSPNYHPCPCSSYLLFLQVFFFTSPSSEIFMSRTRNIIVAAGLVAFASAGLAFPFYMATKSSKAPIIDSSKPLPPQATFRGPYVNTGSRDVGPDLQTYSKK